MKNTIDMTDVLPSDGCNTLAPSCSDLVGKYGKFSTWDGEICVCVVLAESVDLPWDDNMLYVRYIMPMPYCHERYGYIPRARFVQFTDPATAMNKPQKSRKDTEATCCGVDNSCPII